MHPTNEPSRYCMSKAMYNQYKNDPIFISFLTFGRILNSINYCRNTLIAIKPGASKPSEIRATQNYFFFICGILHEGINELRKSKNIYKDFEIYKTKTTLYLKKVNHFDKAVLGKIRKKTAYHYDKECFQKSINSLSLDEYTLLLSSDKSYDGTYYMLSDIIALNILFDDIKDEKGTLIFIEQIASNIKSYTDEFVAIVSEIMTESINKMGWFPEGPQSNTGSSIYLAKDGETRAT